MPICVEVLAALVRLGDGTYGYGDPYSSTINLAGNGTHVVVKGATAAPSAGDRIAIGRACYALGFRTYEWERQGKRTVYGEIHADGSLTICRRV